VTRIYNTFKKLKAQGSENEKQNMGPTCIESQKKSIAGQIKIYKQISANQGSRQTEKVVYKNKTMHPVDRRRPPLNRYELSYRTLGSGKKPTE